MRRFINDTVHSLRAILGDDFIEQAQTRQAQAREVRHQAATAALATRRAQGGAETLRLNAQVRKASDTYERHAAQARDAQSALTIAQAAALSASASLDRELGRLEQEARATANPRIATALDAVRARFYAVIGERVDVRIAPFAFEGVSVLERRNVVHAGVAAAASAHHAVAAGLMEAIGALQDLQLQPLDDAAVEKRISQIVNTVNVVGLEEVVSGREIA